MPQNENLSLPWRTALGPDWKRVHQTWLHSLGNLTLTGYNSEYSDRPFSEKRDMIGGFRQKSFEAQFRDLASSTSGMKMRSKPEA